MNAVSLIDIDILPGPLQMLQHPWTYKPLVHDVLGLALNKVTVEAPEPAGPAPAVLKPPPKRQTFEVTCDASFQPVLLSG